MAAEWIKVRRELRRLVDDECDRHERGHQGAELSFGDDPCAELRSVLEIAQGVEQAALAVSQAATAAREAAEMALMNCEAENSP